MSRVGKQPVALPDGVKVSLKGMKISVDGPKGKLDYEMPQGITAELNEKDRRLTVKRSADSKQQRALHGLARSLIQNMVTGVSEGYVRSMEIIGVGYNVKLQGKDLQIQVGFAHPVNFPLPDGIEVEIQAAANPGRFTIRGIDKQQVGQTAADIRAIRPPEPYQGKGIKYADEVIRRKAGKAFVGAAGL